MSGNPGWPSCQYFETPSDAERAELGITDPDVVFDCGEPQGEGPLFFFVPVHGGAVRAGVCQRHADLLAGHHGTPSATGS